MDLKQPKAIEVIKRMVPKIDVVIENFRPGVMDKLGIGYETLKKLNQDFGISFLYITHDLTTAYQVSDNIIVLYRGSVAETGDVARVIKDPQHPYTQLLVSSIPLPNPDRRWGEHVVAAANAANGHANNGCLFADRCPYVMPRCRETPPPLYRMESYRAASCYLREEGASVLEGDITQVFREQALATGGERMH